ncbi:hypothetical protein DIPPA_23770 [Diplonema papillatum]|nr:hypothetical protein DIPPA_23770 [Diplonema papillatum]
MAAPTERVQNAVLQLSTALTVNPKLLPEVQNLLTGLSSELGGTFFGREVAVVLATEHPLPNTPENAVQNNVIRQAAGMILKQHLANDASVRCDEVIRSVLLRTLSAHVTSNEVVNATCSCVLMCKTGTSWDDLFGFLASQLATASPAAEAAMHCLTLICEDFAGTDRIMLARAIPAAVTRLPSPSALTLLRHLYTLPEDDTGEVARLQGENISSYAQHLLSITDPSRVVANLPDLANHWECIKPKEAMLLLFQKAADAAYRVLKLPAAPEEAKISAITFFSEASFVAGAAPLFSQMLPDIVRAVCALLRWNDGALTECGLTNDDDCDVPDDERQTALSVNRTRRFGGFGKDDDDEDEPDEENDVTGDRLVEVSGLRSEAQLFFSVIVEDHAGEVADSALQLLRAAMSDDSNEDWRWLEATITLFGSISGTCSTVMFKENSVALIAVLQALTDRERGHPFALVRDACLWTIEQIALGLIELWESGQGELSDEDDESPAPTLSGDDASKLERCISSCLSELLRAVASDKNKRCKKTAITGIRSLVTAGVPEGSAFALRVLAEAAATTRDPPLLQVSNRCKAWECLSLMIREMDADVKPDVPDANVFRIICPYLQHLLTRNSPEQLLHRIEVPALLCTCIEMIRKCSVTEQGLLFTLPDTYGEAMVRIAAYVVTSVGHFVQQYYTGATHTVSHVGPASMILALDLVSAVSDNLPAVFNASTGTVKELLAISLSLGQVFTSEAGQRDSSDVAYKEDIVQACAALTGDLVTNDYSCIAEAVPQILAFLVAQADFNTGICRVDSASGITARCNVLWAASEIVAKARGDGPAKLTALFGGPGPVASCAKSCAAILKDPGLAAAPDTKGLRENAASLLGRLALAGLLPTDYVEPDLVTAWCAAMIPFSPSSEKEEAVAGFASLSRATPACLLLVGQVFICWLRRSPGTFPASLRSMVAQGLFLGLPSCPPFVAVPDPVGVVFRHYDAQGDGHWKLPGANQLARDSGVPPLDEAKWKGLCKKLGASPKRGLDFRRVCDLYNSGLKTLDKDYAVVCTHIARGLAPGR